MARLSFLIALHAVFSAGMACSLDRDSSAQTPYQQEQQALNRILKLHPKVELERLEVLPAERALKEARRADPESTEQYSGGLLVWTRVRASDVQSIGPFRKALQADLILNRAFPTMEFVPEGWRIADDADLPDPMVRLGWALLSVMPPK